MYHDKVYPPLIEIGLDIFPDFIIWLTRSSSGATK